MSVPNEDSRSEPQQEKRDSNLAESEHRVSESFVPATVCVTVSLGAKPAKAEGERSIVHRLDTVALLHTCFPCFQTCQTHLTILPTHPRWLKVCHKTELHLTLSVCLSLCLCTFFSLLLLLLQLLLLTFMMMLMLIMIVLFAFSSVLQTFPSNRLRITKPVSNRISVPSTLENWRG